MIIAVINQKGGVGKTTTAAAIGAGMTHRGAKVLFLDLDPQGNLTFSLQADPEGATIADVLADEAKAADAVQRVAAGDIIPSAPTMAAAEYLIGKDAEKLKKRLRAIAGKYDRVIIDTPPALGPVMINALTAADAAIITAQADIYSVQGINQIAETLDTVRSYTNPHLQLAGILLTRYSPRATLTKEMEAAIAQQAESLGTRLFDSRIRENVKLREAATMQQDIFTYAPKSNGAADYAAFLDELERRLS